MFRRPLIQSSKQLRSDVKSRSRSPIGIVPEDCLLESASTGGCVFTLKLYIKGAELGTVVGIFMVPKNQNILDRCDMN